ncbi:MAG: hypothetical protein RI100_07380 [Nitrosarchaeum sp.]|uniref:hypothetical protein n=1 Tax=Nitrosarchaeum sp. TaxID=2026886 RepID=UPI002DE67992|nr:hypothetical protein [Nitrosarchaeum sp.]
MRLLDVLKPPVLQKNISDETVDQKTDSDVKFQDIVYYMHTRTKTVQNEPINFFKAIDEMQKLDWKYSPNYIGFTNNNTQENVQFSRTEQDKWYAETLIKPDGNWNGYVWCCYSEFKTIENMLELFFEEVSWSQMLSWKLKRIGKYAND